MAFSTAIGKGSLTHPTVGPRSGQAHRPPARARHGLLRRTPIDIGSRRPTSCFPTNFMLRPSKAASFFDQTCARRRRVRSDRRNHPDGSSNPANFKTRRSSGGLRGRHHDQPRDPTQRLYAKARAPLWDPRGSAADFRSFPMTSPSSKWPGGSRVWACMCVGADGCSRHRLHELPR